LFFSIWTSIHPTQALTSFSPESQTPCKIIGDPDIYGLGVRLGFYLQYFSVVIALFLNPKAAHNARTNLNVFAAALFIHEFQSANNPKSIIMIEVLIVIYMTVFLTVFTFPLQYLRQSTTSVSTMGIVYCAYMLWLPWLALNRQNQGLKPGCSVVLLFGHVKSSNHNWQYFMKVITCLAIPRFDMWIACHDIFMGDRVVVFCRKRIEVSG
jgi:hypothetical protein